MLIQKYFSRAWPSADVSFCSREYSAVFPLQYWTRKMSSMIRPAAINLTSACWSPEESFEVSTRSGVGAKRAVIFCNSASPAECERVFRTLTFCPRAGMATNPASMISANDAVNLIPVSSGVKPRILYRVPLDQ